MLPAAAAAAVISQMDLGGNWYNELKNWALNLWENVRQRRDSDPVVQPPDSTTGKPEYGCVALQNEVTNLKAKMSSQRVRPPSYIDTLKAANISVEPEDVIEANRTEFASFLNNSTQEQQQALKDVRKRGQNQRASKASRRRKTDLVENLKVKLFASCQYHFKVYHSKILYDWV